MSEINLNKKRNREIPSIYSVENDFDQSIENDRRQQLENRLLRDIMYSNEPIERLAVKAVMAGLLSYAQYEDSFYESKYSHKDGFLFFGGKDEEQTSKRVRRLIVER